MTVPANFVILKLSVRIKNNTFLSAQILKPNIPMYGHITYCHHGKSRFITAHHTSFLNSHTICPFTFFLCPSPDRNRQRV